MKVTKRKKLRKLTEILAKAGLIGMLACSVPMVYDTIQMEREKSSQAIESREREIRFDIYKKQVSNFAYGGLTSCLLIMPELTLIGADLLEMGLYLRRYNKRYQGDKK